jgi:hypothetical protein
MGVRGSLSRVLVVLCVLVGVLVCGVAGAGATVSQFGSRGEGAGQFSNVSGVAVDQATGDVYLLDEGNVRVDKFSGEGSFLLAWGWGVADGTQGLQTCTTTCYHGSVPDYGPGTGEFGLGVSGVAVDNDPLSVSYEDVYVPDPGNNRVEKFSPSGAFLGMFGKEVNENGTNVCVAGEKCRPGKEGGGDGEFDDITGAIAVGPNGNVYVGGDNRVQVFSPEGVFVSQMVLSTGLTHRIAVDQAGDVYVVSLEPSNLSEYDASGTFLRAFDGGGEPRAVALDAAGGVFVDDLTRSNPAAERHHLLEFGPAGEELASFDPGSEEVDGVGGIVFGESIGKLYVPFWFGNQVVRLVSVPSPGPQLFGEESVSGVEPQGATLGVTINSENNATSYRFEYGLTSAYGSSAPSPEGLLSASFNYEPVSVTVAKLVPGTTYHYRVVARDSKGHTTIGPDATFTTPTAVSIDSEYATNVASTSATIGGELNPWGVEATYRIEYDTSEYAQGGPSHGTALPEASLGSGSGDVPVSAHVAGLLPGTVYHYRIVARDTREGVPYTIQGPDQTFLTQPAKSVFVLPDGRQWEQVSPVDKLGAGLIPVGVMQASVSGDRISYIADTATELEPEGNRSLEPAQLFSVRGTGGWSTRDIDTPNETIGGVRAGHDAEYHLFSSDLSTAALEPLNNSPLPPLPKGAEKTIYLRDDLNGTYEPLVTASNVPAGTKFGGHQDSEGHELQEGTVGFRGATPDLSHVVLESPAALTSDAVEQSGRESLYEWAGGKLALVSVLPDGESASRQGSAALGYNDSVVRHAISDDGSRVVWEGERAARHLYLRDMTRGASGETVQVDAAQGVKEPEAGETKFRTADSSGSRVFFTSAARLMADSPTSGDTADLYVFEVTSGSGEPLAGRLTDLTVDHNAGEKSDVKGVLGASEDGTSIFFAASGLLGDAAGHGVPGSTYLYMERYDRVAGAWLAPHLIAALSSMDANSWGGGGDEERLTEMYSRVSPDGRFVAFMSSRSLTGYDNRDANSGVADEEVFLYDTGTDRVSCVSCNPTGARPVGAFDEYRGTPQSPGLLVDTRQNWENRWLAAVIPSWVNPGDSRSFYQSRYLSDSGRLFFESPDALVPSDTNGTWDVYEFEPQGTGSCTSGSSLFQAALGGCVGLISSGGSKEESVFLDASETGDDVFFLTTAGLVSQDGDGLFDVYDAHVCSGAVPCLPVAPVLPPECSTSDSCKAAPSPQPAGFGAPASQTFSGAGNTVIGVSGGVRSRSLTRAQKLTRALRACARRPKHERSVCKRRARRRYGASVRVRRSTINESLPVRAGR